MTRRLIALTVVFWLCPTLALAAGSGRGRALDRIAGMPVETVIERQRTPLAQTGPVNVMRAHARPSSRIELFAGTRGFRVGRPGAVFDIEGGASLQLVRQLSLTGSYRMLGYDLKATGTQNFSPQLAGPFFALSLEF